jgi:parvulin-like peptidyl-prolyl isomerase
VREKLIKNLSVSEEELKKYFKLSSTKVRARHLYAPTREKADSLYQMVHNGHSFEDLAKSAFRDPALSESGGDLGYFTYDEMDYAFSDRAFAMKIGEISPPVKTKDGYSIIKIEDRKGNPFFTDSEYLKKRSQLYAAYRSRKKKVLARNLVDSLSRSLNIRYVEQGLNVLLPIFKYSDVINKNFEFSSKNHSNLKKDQPLVQFNNSEWSVGDLLEKAKFTSKAQHKWIRSKENLEEFITGLVVRQYVLNQADQMGLLTSDGFHNEFRREMDRYLISRVKDHIKSEMIFSEEHMKTYYADNSDLFKRQSKVLLNEILINDDKTAKEVAQRLKSGENFSALARKFSVNKHTAVLGGEVGYVSETELGPFAETVLSLKKDEWVGPYKKGSFYFFLQMKDILAADPDSFESLKPRIQEKLIAENLETEMENRLKTIRKNTLVKSYPEKLRTIKYN